MKPIRGIRRRWLKAVEAAFDQVSVAIESTGSVLPEGLLKKWSPTRDITAIRAARSCRSWDADVPLGPERGGGAGKDRARPKSQCTPIGDE